MLSWANLLSQTFNGLVIGALLALISSGLTIIYGTLGVLNLAHGAMFMVGGYAGVVAYQYTGSFLVAIAAGACFVLVLGVLMERLIIRHFYERPAEDQILVTFGLGIVFVETIRFFFGSLSQSMPPPSWAAGVTSLGFMIYPTYRLAVVGIIAVALLALYLVLYRSRLGMIVRAGIEDSVMVDSLGINVMRVFMIVFGIGSMAAGFAGIVNVPIAPITPDIGEATLVEAFVVVVIGGVGSFPGAVLGGLIAGEILSLTSMINPSYSQVMLFAVMTLVLVLRPRGLLGARGTQLTMNKRPRGPRAFLPEASIALVLLVAPFVLPKIGLVPDTMNRILVFGLFGVGFDLLFGYAGMLSFGQSAFFGTGGFIAAYLLTQTGLTSVMLGLAIGTVGAAIVGYFVGLIALRRTGIYFAMITVAIGEVFFFMENGPLSSFTGGENGLPGVPGPTFNLGFATIHATSGWSMYGFLAVSYVVGIVIGRRIVASPVGLIWVAIRENPLRAAAVGHNVHAYKLLAFVIAAAYSGAAGGLLGVMQGYMPPDAFTFDTSGQIIMMTVIGGLETLFGPLVGATVWLYLRDFLQGGWVSALPGSSCSALSSCCSCHS